MESQRGFKLHIIFIYPCSSFAMLDWRAKGESKRSLKTPLNLISSSASQTTKDWGIIFSLRLLWRARMNKDYMESNISLTLPLFLSLLWFGKLRMTWDLMEYQSFSNSMFHESYQKGPTSLSLARRVGLAKRVGLQVEAGSSQRGWVFSKRAGLISRES